MQTRWFSRESYSMHLNVMSLIATHYPDFYDIVKWNQTIFYLDQQLK